MELLGYGRVTFISRFPNNKENIWGETLCDSDLSESSGRLMKCIEVLPVSWLRKLPFKEVKQHANSSWLVRELS